MESPCRKGSEIADLKREESRPSRDRHGRTDRVDRAVEGGQEAGAEVDLVSLESGEIQGFNHCDKADRFIEAPEEELVHRLADVLPTGVWRPVVGRSDLVRPGHSRALAGPFQAKPFHESEDPTREWYVPAHEPPFALSSRWLSHRECHLRGNLVTSRSPDGIPVFNERLLELFALTPVGASW